MTESLNENIPKIVAENIYRHGDHIHVAPRLTVTVEQFGYYNTLILWKGDVRIAEADHVSVQTLLTDDDREWIAEWAHDALVRLALATVVSEKHPLKVATEDLTGCINFSCQELPDNRYYVFAAPINETGVCYSFKTEDAAEQYACLAQERITPMKTYTNLQELTGQESGIIIYRNSFSICNWSHDSGIPYVGPSFIDGMVGMPIKIEWNKRSSKKIKDIGAYISDFECIYDANDDLDGLSGYPGYLFCVNNGDYEVIAPAGWN